MRYIDMHCDTLLKAFESKNPNGIASLPEAQVDLERMQEHVAAQFFAVFLPPSEELITYGIGDMEYILSLRDIFLNSLQCFDKVHPTRTLAELEVNIADNVPSAVLTMEDGRAAEGRFDRIKYFYDLGFRAIALTWNGENCFGYPNSADRIVMASGLKPFGREAVEYMQELGIIVDVSHLSDGGFWDVARICKKPFIASHSNCRALAPFRRNLTDEMIRALAGSGGVIGLNFCPGFIERELTAEETTARAIARHARHMADVGGTDCVAVGTDFDGFDGTLDISDCTHMGLLFKELERIGFTQSELEKIAYKNVMRVISDTWA